MTIQPSLDLAPAPHLAASLPRQVRLREPTGVFLLTGGLYGDAASRLLHRALTESGLIAHEPVELASRDGLRPPHWRRRDDPPRLLIAFGAEVAAGVLGRPVSLALERGRQRPLPDGGRLLVTEHPGAILRLADPVARGREYRRLVNDLMLAVPHRRLAA